MDSQITRQSGSTARGWLDRLYRFGSAVPQWVRTVLVAGALLTLLLVPRLSQLDALVTPDEPLWIARSANFYQALKTGHFADTYQFVHPGVPVMWLGAFGYFVHIRDMPELMGQQIGVRQREAEDVLAANNLAILDVLVQLRQVVIVASALIVIAIFFLLTKIVRFWAAAAGIAFLALDPMHIGFTRLLHLDGFSANLVILSVVAFCWYMQTKSRVALISAGVITGIACLTRSANAVLGPFFGLVALADVAIAWRKQKTFPIALARSLVVSLIVVGLISLVVFFVFWPAMWVNPIGTLRELASGGRDLAAGGAERDIFFRGEVTKDPGPLYYPIVLIHRLSGLTIAGLVLAIIAILRPHDFGAKFPRQLAVHLMAFSAIYVAILSVSSKKLDRYVLPSVAGLDLVAGIAWVVAAVWIARRLPLLSERAARVAAVGLVLVVLLGQADYALRFRPFYIDAASPVVGGVDGARDAFSYNWGEGGKQVAEALLTIPDIESATVVAGPWEKTVDYYLPFRLHRPEYGSNLRIAAVWMDTDYIVVSYPEIQRELYSPLLLDWFAAQTPLRIVNTIDGEYARIYDIRNVPPPDAYYSNVPKANWSGVGTVLAARFPESRRTGTETISATLLVQTNGQAGSVQVRAQFVGTDDTIAAEASKVVSYTPNADGIAEITFKFQLPPSVPAGRYRVLYSLFDGDTGFQLPGTNLIKGTPITGMVLIGTVVLKAPSGTQ